MRRKSKRIRIGSKYIGENEPIAIQSMTNTKTCDVKRTVEQIKSLEEAGCEIIRVAVPDMDSAAAIRDIKRQIGIPLVADIHFDYRLALEAIKNGVDKIRINPGNIGELDRIKQVITAAKSADIAVRIGVNSGSLEKEILAKYGGPTPDALVESAVKNIRQIEDMNFENMVIAIKSSDVLATIDGYIKLSEKTDYPLHIGITESGTVKSGTVKSAIGIGTLLYMGIGDTIRVSLTGDPVKEIYVAQEILKALRLGGSGIEIISCPTCGRTNVDLIPIAEKVENALREMTVDRPLKVAIMGCAVNGPGEAREVDIGIAGGKGEFLLFVKGEVVRKISEDKVITELVNEIKKLCECQE
ncbi:MAG: flavodoxin-dependent (E)-4-hydroxy-3-methylbut-2-enyl-diphosphate synthase [Bacillota bacterium]